MKSKVLGSMLMVAGTTIGAGMLVMPINSAEVGLLATIIELVLFFLLMLLPALVVVEGAQFAPRGSTVAGILRLEFGNLGFFIGNVLFYIFVYSLVCAYIAGLSSVFAEILGVAKEYHNYFIVAMVIPLGLIVTFTSRFADLVNRTFFYIMCIAFAILVVMSLPNLEVQNLSSLPISSKAVLKSVPILFLAYGYHIIIPALSDYLDRNAKDLRTALVGGMLIPLVVFIIWNVMVHGQASQAQLIEFTKNGESINIANLISKNNPSKFLEISITVFSISALLTSFIGVSLALITTLKETFAKKLPKKSEYVLDHLEPVTGKAKLIEHTPDDEVIYGETDRIQTYLNRPLLFLITFGVPTFVVIFTPEAFVFFLRLAALIFTVQNLILPIFSLMKLRKNHPEFYRNYKVYRVPLNNIGLNLLALALFVFCIFSM